MKESHFAIILEGLRSDFKAVAEGLTVLDHKIDSVEKRLIIEIDGLRSQINFVYSNLSDRINKVNDTLSKRIDGVENNLSDLTSSVGGLEHNLSNKIDRTMDRIENHELRLIKLERKTSSC